MFSWTDPRKRPVIVAHRGASSVAPENTLAAFRRAIDGGAEAIELDVRLTKDGEVVVFHDAHLRRTTNGRGRVEEYALSELMCLSAGSWFRRSFASEKIPTLSDVFELVEGRVGLNIEIKTTFHGRTQFDIVERCCTLIQQHHAASHVLVSSFSHHHIRRMKRLLPHVTTGLLFHPLKHLGRSALRLAQQVRVEFMFFGGKTLRKHVVEQAHERKLHVGEYTVNTKRRLARAERYGIDVVITDDPARMILLRSQHK